VAGVTCYQILFLHHSVKGVAFHGKLKVRVRQLVSGVRPCESIVLAMTECVGVACASTTRLLHFLRSRVRSALKAPNEERHA
jgi:hypothetical protein